MAKKNKLWLASKEDIQLAVRRRSTEIARTLSDQEVFLSKEFRSYTTRLMDFILQKRCQYKLQIVYDQANPDIAYTDNITTFLNAGNYLAAEPEDLVDRFDVNMGILFHEGAHCLFSDFSATKKAWKQFGDGQLYAEPIGLCAGHFQDPQIEQAWTELQNAMQSEAKRSALFGLLQMVENVIADGHDEAAMKEAFPGYIGRCIKKAGEVQLSKAPSISEMIAQAQSALAILLSMVLLYAKYQEYPPESSAALSADVQPYMDRMAALEPIIRGALDAATFKERYSWILLLLLNLWSYIDLPDDASGQGQGGDSGQSQNGNSDQGQGGGSGQSQGGDPGHNGNSGQAGQNGQPGQSGSSGQSGDNSGNSNPQNGTGSQTPGQSQQGQGNGSGLSQAMSQAQSNVPSQPAPQNRTGKPLAQTPQQAASGGGQAQAPGSGGMESIVSALSNEKAAQQVQGEMDQALLDELRNSNLPLIHRRVPVSIKRHHTANSPKAYQRIWNEIAPATRNLTTAMKNLFRELNDSGVQHHRIVGPMVEATEAYRPDQKFFAAKRQPQDIPDMALTVLIDQSGSMDGRKLEAARKMAVMLERFTAELGIPTMIAAHQVRSSGVVLNVFTAFASAMEESERLSLAEISCGGCNRDGLPIAMLAEKLAQRPEQIRMMIVISDGAPNDDGYRGKEAMKDISDTVQKYRRQGVMIFGAAIDEDAEVIQDIYKGGYLSISDLSTLPRTMVRLIRQNIVS